VGFGFNRAAAMQGAHSVIHLI